MDLEHIKNVHCIGIGGIGVSALARFFSSRGSTVTGSDEVDGEEVQSLRKKGFEVHIGHDAENVGAEVDLVVYSSAIEDSNPELLEAQDRAITTLSYTEALGAIMTAFTSVAVSGTNGKTTTTALLGALLEASQKDPTVIVGGHVSGWDKNLRVGTSDVFVAEACEYRRNMLNLHPHIIVLTNIEEDHLDYYKDIDDIRDAFSEYIGRLTADDLLVCNADDDNIRLIASNTTAKIVTFGLSDDVHIQAKDISYVDGVQQFTLSVFGEDVGTLSMRLPGAYNVYNALGAIAASLDLGADIEELKKGLAAFPGTWRRFEQVGDVEGVTIISDYAHHPSAVRQTLAAAREMYHDKRILAVFQPHQKNRTVKLFDQFTESFAQADTLVLAEIYEVAGREDSTLKISSRDLARAIQDRGGVDEVLYTSDVDDTLSKVRKRIKDFDVVLVMGAGSIDEVARRLAQG
jgi:UDP-N-acetylmuramate--alanine ligase